MEYLRGLKQYIDIKEQEVHKKLEAVLKYVNQHTTSDFIRDSKIDVGIFIQLYKEVFKVMSLKVSAVFNPYMLDDELILNPNFLIEMKLVKYVYTKGSTPEAPIITLSKNRPEIRNKYYLEHFKRRVKILTNVTII